MTFLYTSNEQVEFEIENTMSLTLALFKTKIFRYKPDEICTNFL